MPMIDIYAFVGRFGGLGKRRAMLLRSVLALVPLAALTANAADVSREGTDSYTTSYVVVSRSTMQLGDRSIALTEFAGISRNASGGGLFNNMGTRCLGMSETVGGVYAGRGSCSNNDSDGDQIFLNYQYERDAGVYTISGGTGKYAKLSGTAEYTIQTYQAPDGRLLFVVPHKVHWKIS